MAAQSKQIFFIVGIVALIALLFSLEYMRRRERLWTLNDPEGHAICRVESGWTKQDVAAHCGAPTGRGMQPKVPGGGGFIPQMCSAPGDVYGNKAVLYGCDGRVNTVELMPAHLFFVDP
jgi:hypothetical protein